MILILIFGFDESAKNVATDIVAIESAVSSIKWDKEKVESVLFASDVITEVRLEDIDYLTEFCCKYPNMISKDKFIEALQFADKQASKNGIINFNKINCYSENIEKLVSMEDPIYNIQTGGSFDNIFVNRYR